MDSEAGIITPSRDQARQLSNFCSTVLLVMAMFISSNAWAVTAAEIKARAPLISFRAATLGLRDYDAFTRLKSTPNAGRADEFIRLLGVAIGLEAKRELNVRYFTIVDFTLPSSHKRLFIIDTVTGVVESLYVSHGLGSGAGKWLDHTSNELIQNSETDFSSERTPIGRFVADTAIYRKRTRNSLALVGLSRANRNTYERGVFLHGAIGVDPSSDYAHKNNGPRHSDGCFMVEAKLTDAVINKIKGRSFFYVYWNSGGLQKNKANPLFK